MDETLTLRAEPAGRPAGQPKLWIKAAVLAAVLVVGVLSAWLVVGRSAGANSGRLPSTLEQSAFQDETGVRIVRISVTAGGGLIDVRYQVVDPGKAEVIHDSLPKLIEEKTGQEVSTLFMGHAHENDPKTGYTYPLLLVNGGGLIHRGTVVSVVIDDARLEHIAVE